MCIKKIRKFQKKYNERCRNFYSSTIAGLSTGFVIGILFSLITDSKFNRWINLFSYEFFAALIYFVFVLILLYILYHLGKGVMEHILHYKKKDLINYKINYFAGIYSAIGSASFVILHSQTQMIIYVLIFFILFYFPIQYLTVRTKKKSK